MIYKYFYVICFFALYMLDNNIYIIFNVEKLNFRAC